MRILRSGIVKYYVQGQQAGGVRAISTQKAGPCCPPVGAGAGREGLIQSGGEEDQEVGGGVLGVFQKGRGQGNLERFLGSWGSLSRSLPSSTSNTGKTRFHTLARPFPLPPSNAPPPPNAPLGASPGRCPAVPDNEQQRAREFLRCLSIALLLRVNRCASRKMRKIQKSRTKKSTLPLFPPPGTAKILNSERFLPVFFPRQSRLCFLFCFVSFPTQADST